MKEILAVIRLNMMNQTKLALAEAGFPAMTGTGRVQGRGKGLVDMSVLSAAQEGNETAIAMLGGGPRLIPKRILLLVVDDGQVEKAVETIMSVNRTGHPGDGKIFVSPVSDVYNIRTGKSGPSVL